MIPVSYTHLDVYKRQVVNTAKKAAKTIVNTVKGVAKTAKNAAKHAKQTYQSVKNRVTSSLSLIHI